MKAATISKLTVHHKCCKKNPYKNYDSNLTDKCPSLGRLSELGACYPNILAENIFNFTCLLNCTINKTSILFKIPLKEIWTPPYLLTAQT